MGGVGMGMGYGMGRGGRNVKGKFNNTVEWLITQLNQDITVKSELLEPETSSLFRLDTSVDIALTGELYDKLIQPVYF
jgi:hypothetical protein